MFVGPIFFSNYFYGLCAVALSVEATLQQRYPFNSLPYYIFIFAVTVLYYTRAYITERSTGHTNPRSQWYGTNRKWVQRSQLLLTVTAIIYLVQLMNAHWSYMVNMPLVNIGLLFIFPAIAAFYYGLNHKSLARYNLRNIGWLKPFIIGFVWAGLVTIYPILFYNIEREASHMPDLIGIFLFVKNFMFITVLCIMFDIKDYASDHNRQLKTFVVKAGLRKTIFFILIPLCLAGLASFIYFGIARQFSLPKITINVIPFLLMMIVAYSMHRRKSIIYYLTVIDGLMLVKAFCGTIAMLYF